MRRAVFLIPGSLWLLLPFFAAADDPEAAKLTAKYAAHVERGLHWLAKQQLRDGHWEAQGGNYPVPLTALAGMALLAEGSTPHQGKYAKEIDRAVEYLLSRAQRSGLIGNPGNPLEQQRYMYGHGFGLLFLSQVYGEVNDLQRQAELKGVLTRAVEYTGKAQTRLGGWGYVTAEDGNHFDEGSVTITQVQALRAARNAGVPVSKDIIDKAQEYLKKSTIPAAGSQETEAKRREAGVIYSLQRGGGPIRAPLTAAAIACLFNSGEYESELALQWLNYCQKYLAVNGSDRDTAQHWEYTHYYYGQVLYTLGEGRHAQLRADLAEQEKRDPTKKVLLKWSRYREGMFEAICAGQSADGSWAQGRGFSSIGPVYSTSLYLTILQLDKGNLPIYQR